MWRGLWGYGPVRGPEHYSPAERTSASSELSESSESTESSVGSGFDVVAIILRCRRTADLSQRDLAERLGVSASLVARWETGERQPSAEALAAVVALAGYRLAVLDHRDERVRAAPGEPLRDRGGRRVPVHLDVVLDERWTWRSNRYVPGGWEQVATTVHAPRRRRRDMDRAFEAHKPVEVAPGCVPFQSRYAGARRLCRDIPTLDDHAHWQAVVRELHESRRAALRSRRRPANQYPGPAPEPCRCELACHEQPSCLPACPCQCEPELDLLLR
ncbi:helix-turn-helix domain-containing protein [Propionibacteriaceae bacterium G1746]|uniref:helix-turn-helix domain-containing protein n=1 Tax=Aestuariimicrobium sp. G57 TaxID=3418485 RepID=UPI003C17F0C3